MNYKELAELLFPNITTTVEEIEKKYPKRNLPEGAKVTRFAPSPTGFVHMGSLLSAFENYRFAHDSNGVFFLRIEDTDQERSVENGISGIVRDLANFGIVPDEGMLNENESKGNYGPYIQSMRKEIYQTYIKDLVSKGLAYPCFCSHEMLDETRTLQELNKERIGYYGSYARCRNLTMEEVKNHLAKGDKYVIRLKSPGDFNNKVVLHDEIRGDIEFPENDQDIVILKSNDSLPTYHFAHAVDDHLMHTTHVMRGEEWVSSYPVHEQLFKVLGFELPKYAHLGLVMKIDEDGTRRKLSKRKDPEASVSFYHEKGVPIEAVKIYLMTIANSNFEAWMDEHPNEDYRNFKLSFDKISVSGSLFDIEKLFNISKNYISKMTSEDLYNEALKWALEFDKELYDLMKKYDKYTKDIFSIERYQEKPRKDYSSYSDIKSHIWYMYDELFNPTSYEWQKITDRDEITKIVMEYFDNYYDQNDDKETWFNKVKMLTEKLGYAANMKDYRKNPENYKGSVADISTVIRVMVTSRSMTPDLYEILKLLGPERIKKRLLRF
mgnify:FL=1